MEIIYTEIEELTVTKEKNFEVRGKVLGDCQGKVLREKQTSFKDKFVF